MPILKTMKSYHTNMIYMPSVRGVSQLSIVDTKIAVYMPFSYGTEFFCETLSIFWFNGLFKCRIFCIIEIDM